MKFPKNLFGHMFVVSLKMIENNDKWQWPMGIVLDVFLSVYDTSAYGFVTFSSNFMDLIKLGQCHLCYMVQLRAKGNRIYSWMLETIPFFHYY